MDQRILDRYPSVDYLRQRARRRIPHFGWEYLDSGTGRDDCARRNREVFSRVILTPSLLRGQFTADPGCSLFGIDYSAPFGVAPVGLTGLMWPGIECMLARAAARYRLPMTLSMMATEAPEPVASVVDGMGWFQLYPPRDPQLRRDILARVRASGFTTLLVTADVPTGSTRERQRRAGISVPPRVTARMLWQCALRPAWTLATLRHGKPRFRGLEAYIDAVDMQFMNRFIGEAFGGSLDWSYLEAVRDEWDGPVVVKGLLDVEQAVKAAELGFDGIVVSNHGGRQTDAAPTSLEVLPAIRAAVGGRSRLLLDSGVRSGLDIARALALGADFVLLGRAFVYGVAALGEDGADLVMHILLEDLKNNMTQLGCARVDELAGRLASGP